MNKKLRIVFVYCWDDPWIAVVAEDMYEATKTMGHELFVVAADKNCNIDRKSYINTDSFKSNYYLCRVFKSLHYSNIDLTELTNLEYKLLKQLFGREKESKDEIQRRLHLWLAEAMVILKIIQPDVVIVWNGLFSKWAVYVKASKYLKIPVYYAEKGMLPNSWYIDPKGINVMSSVAEREMDLNITKNEIDEFKKTLDTIDERGESAWEQPYRKDVKMIKKGLGIKENQKVIFFPGQVDSDSNIVLFSEHFMNSLDALRWLVKGLSKDEFFILAKPHPKGSLKAEDFEKVITAKGKVLPEINVLDAIELADCIVSINSTITFEAAIRAKPVLLLGQGILFDKDYVSNYISGIDAYAQVIKCIERYNENKDDLYNKAVSFATYLDSKYYAYREDCSKTVHLLKKLAEDIDGRREKLLGIEEIAAFFQEVPYEDFENYFLQRVSLEDINKWFSGRDIVKALFDKLKDRFIS